MKLKYEKVYTSFYYNIEGDIPCYGFRQLRLPLGFKSSSLIGLDFSWSKNITRNEPVGIKIEII